MADNSSNNNQESLLGGHAQYVKGMTEVKLHPIVLPLAEVTNTS